MWLDSLDRCASTDALAPMSVAPGQRDLLEPDYPGIRRDTYYFLGLQMGIIAVLYAMPESVSGWSNEQKDEYTADKWWDNVTNPTWDEDDHFINYVLHPYWGATYYVRARERGFSPTGSFWYSALLSTLYEFGVEALFEPVSIQDMFVTPIVGSLVGGYFMNVRDRTYSHIYQAGEARFRDKAALAATDPLGSIADLIERRFGQAVDFQVKPFAATRLRQPFEAGFPVDLQNVFGLTVTARW